MKCACGCLFLIGLAVAQYVIIALVQRWFGDVAATVLVVLVVIFWARVLLATGLNTLAHLS